MKEPPYWPSTELEKHFKKRKKENCLNKLIPVNYGTFSQVHYENISLAVYKDAWLKYHAQKINPNKEPLNYYPLSSYFVDNNLIIAITNLEETIFVTCFHEHNGGGSNCPPSIKNLKEGEKRLWYKVLIDNQITGEVLIKYTVK